MPSSKRIKDLYSLKGRVVFITGGAGFLGKQHAEAVQEAGGTPVLADLAAASPEKALSGVFGVSIDITDPASVKSAVAKTLKKYGRIDVLINNAALTVKGGSGDADSYFAPFEEYPLSWWTKALEVNLTGMFLVTQEIGKVMLKQKSGVVLNIASDVGTISPDHRIYEGVVNPHTKKPFNTPIAYSTTKAGVISFTRWLATYWAKKGIRVNSISPAGVYNHHEEKFVRQLTERIPMGRMAEPGEYKGAVLFLISDASSFMTGSNLIVDGGRTAW
jgi:NAD(P)-dependent dehydrogenase (short-subunit alcohol dehydrogenase family)